MQFLEGFLAKMRLSDLWELLQVLENDLSDLIVDNNRSTVDNYE